MTALGNIFTKKSLQLLLVSYYLNLKSQGEEQDTFDNSQSTKSSHTVMNQNCSPQKSLLKKL